LWPHGADIANTVPNLFPTRARIKAGTGLIMGDGLTRAVADVVSSAQTLSPVIRGRCRNGLPSERHKTAWMSGPRSCQPGVSRWTRFSASVQIQSPRRFSEMSPSAKRRRDFHCQDTSYRSTTCSNIARWSIAQGEMTELLCLLGETWFKSHRLFCGGDCVSFRPDPPARTRLKSDRLSPTALGALSGATAC
jgi:hypothetical protein